MIVRLSQKIATKIKLSPTRVLPLHSNPFADWSAHVFTADRAQYVMLTNTASLYTTLLHGRGISSDNALLVRGFGQLREFMIDDGQEFIYRRLIAPATSEVHFSKALSRSVTGSMNDLIFHAKVWLTEGELAPHDVGFKLNDIPMGALDYAKPRERFKSLGAGDEAGRVC